MLKNLLITLGLLCSYLGSMFALRGLGLNESMTIIIASVLFGALMHLVVNQTRYLAMSIGITALVFFVFVKDYTSVPMMLSSVLFGHIAIHYLKTRKQRHQRAQRRPLNENREFLN